MHKQVAFFIGVLLLSFNLFSPPISYQLVTDPETGKRIDIIGDLHVKQAKLSEIEQDLLTTIKRMDQKAQQPFTIILEDIDYPDSFRSYLTSKSHYEFLLQIKSLLDQMNLRHVSIVSADHRKGPID